MWKAQSIISTIICVCIWSTSIGIARISLWNEALISICNVSLLCFPLLIFLYFNLYVQSEGGKKVQSQCVPYGFISSTYAMAEESLLGFSWCSCVFCFSFNLFFIRELARNILSVLSIWRQELRGKRKAVNREVENGKLNELH